MVSNAKFEVEKFDGTNNFGMWQCKVLDILGQQKLDITLEDKPDDIEEKDWAKINRQTCDTIRFCLTKDQKYFVMRKTSVKQLWEKLKNKFITMSVENRLYLKKRLFYFQYKQGISMSEYLNSLNRILIDLQNLDIEILNEDKALLLLNYLPDSYDHLTTTLLYGKDTIKFDEIKQKNAQEESISQQVELKALVVATRTIQIVDSSIVNVDNEGSSSDVEEAQEISQQLEFTAANRSKR
ncbi:hypothetical protein F0562_034043 [Nyssa sinensis]|uniref:Retrotransposon Copia-like N-terminal domain-containing protein n=1 Tax=Nyssa sinensis TaxID=561372 RepID=A0A5J5AG20_9ASTE|nr:hypothetical protein F0562_034043 [Nyssa sinensis]